jgi:predicted RNA methylase
MENQYSAFSDTDYITIKETSEILGISYGSVYNWIRHGFLNPHKKKNLFKKKEVISLKNNIENGTIKRLNRYANKSKSKKSFIPLELLKSGKDAGLIKIITSYIHKNNLNINSSLFYLCVNLLIKKNIINNSSFKNLARSNFKIQGRQYLTEELLAWYNESKDHQKKYTDLLKFELPDSSDITGIIYQSLKREGSKNKEGSYYTPDSVIKMISEQYSFKNCNFFDPCCGTGRFLLYFADKISNPDNLAGFDIDLTAVRIARINLIIKYSTANFKPNIFCQNALIDNSLNDLLKNKKIDIIATNPPWGLRFRKNEIKELKSLFPEIKSGESFSYFLKACIDIVPKKSSIVFILPESVLNIKTHRDIRGYILDNTGIIKINHINNKFKNVFTGVIILELSKKENSKTKVIYGNKTYQINSERFKENRDFIFDTSINNKDYKILKKVFSLPHRTLKYNADWALGIVTGNNEKYLEVKKPGNEPVFRGRDITPYLLSEPAYFIKFNPDIFQQTAPLHKYRVKEKLIYKFISKKLVFAYDNKKSLTLNSANILIPEIKSFSIKIIMALFNSTLYNFIFQKKFNTIKVLKSHLEALPVPELDKNQKQDILSHVNSVLKRNNIPENILKIDNMIFNIFKINLHEQAYIKESIK